MVNEKKKDEEAVLGRRFEYESSGSREEARAEAEMFDQRLAALSAERAQCGGELPRRVKFNREVQELRVGRLVACLESLLEKEDDDDEELCYASENSASEAVLGAALLLGDGKVCAWLFLGEETSLGNATFDPLRKRLRLRAGSSCATLSVETMRRIREAVRRMAFDEPLGTSCGARRGDVSKAPDDAGWKFLSCLCWLSQREDDACDAIRLIRDFPDSSCLQAAVSLARDLGFYAVRASWLAEEEESVDVVAGIKCVRWRPSVSSSRSAERGPLDLFVASFDAARGFHVPLVDVGGTTTKGKDGLSATYRQDWAAVKPIAAAIASPFGVEADLAEKKSQRQRRRRSSRVALSAAVECCAIGDVVLNRLPEEEAMSVEHCEALSGSLDVVAEVDVVRRMRDAEDFLEENSTVPSLSAALLASVERAGVRSVRPKDDAWLKSYAELILAKRATIPKLSSGRTTPIDLVPDSSVSAAAFEMVYKGSTSCDAPSRNRVVEHLAQRRRNLDSFVSDATLTPQGKRNTIRKVAVGFVLLCFLVDVTLGLLAMATAATISVFSPTKLENVAYARLVRRESLENLVAERIRELVPICLEAYYNWRRQVVETQISDCLARRYATLAEATTTLAHQDLSIDDFLKLPCDDDPNRVSVASLSPVAKRHVDALQAVVTPTQRRRVYRVARHLLRTRRANELTTESTRPKNVTVEEALVRVGWTFQRDPQFGRVVAYFPPEAEQTTTPEQEPSENPDRARDDDEDAKRLMTVLEDKSPTAGPTRRQRVVKEELGQTREDDDILPRYRQAANRRRRRTRKK